MTNISGIISGENAEPNPPRLASDWHDDDGAYIDSLVGYDASPPTPDELPTGVATLENVTAKAPKRLVCATFPLSGAMAQPIMALTADANRERIYITASNGEFYIADNKILLPGPSQSAAAFESAYGMAYRISFPTNYVLDGYTGALWFITVPNVSPGSQIFSVAAVTS